MGKVQKLVKDPFYKNSFFIMLTSISSSGLGFIFWVFAAKLYPKEDVGIATALISSVSLLVLFTRFGLDQSLVRFFPDGNKDRILSTSILITTVFAILSGVIFITGIKVWSPELSLVKGHTQLYLLFLASSSVASITGVSFIALRKAEHHFSQSLLASLKLLFLFPLVLHGTMGIFSSFGISCTIASVFSILILFKLGIKPSYYDRKFLKDSFLFSAGNYVAGMLITAPSQILPIMVLNVLGAEDAAHYFIAYGIASLLFMIPSAFSTSLFVEGSYGEALKSNTLKSLFAIFLILIPTIVIIYFFSGYLLNFVGKNYNEGLGLLRLMSLSSVFVAIYSVYFSIKKVQKDVKGLIIISLSAFILIISLSYNFMLRFGIIGVGYAWMIGYGLISLVVVMVFIKGGLIKDHISKNPI